MEALKILGGITAGTVFAILIAAYYAKRRIPVGATRDTVRDIMQSPIWLLPIAVPVLSALLIMADAAGWWSPPR